MVALEWGQNFNNREVAGSQTVRSTSLHLHSSPYFLSYTECSHNRDRWDARERDLAKRLPAEHHSKNPSRIHLPMQK
jgi:hypothetical protein